MLHHQPETSKLCLVFGGPDMTRLMILQERIQSVVRKVCGIGLCNQYTPPSMFTACMAIAACELSFLFCYQPLSTHLLAWYISPTPKGVIKQTQSSQDIPKNTWLTSMPHTVGDQFHDRQDQQACLDILKRTEKDHARPTEAVQRQMMKSWDMSDEMRSQNVAI